MGGNESTNVMIPFFTPPNEVEYINESNSNESNIEIEEAQLIMKGNITRPLPSGQKSTQQLEQHIPQAQMS